MRTALVSKTVNEKSAGVAWCYVHTAVRDCIPRVYCRAGGWNSGCLQIDSAVAQQSIGVDTYKKTLHTHFLFLL